MARTADPNYFVDFVLSFSHFTPGPLLVNPVHHPITELLVTLSLLLHS